MARTRRQLGEQRELAEGGGEAASDAGRGAETGRETGRMEVLQGRRHSPEPRHSIHLASALPDVYAGEHPRSTCTARDTQF